ncbi:hypothetical protein [Microbulbifer thermotolerans]|uniref:Uncharacterized protein n=1 Tax=Microbulbifer thermotolerans TaxID=252514 RepID=A0A143HNX1_MICTH|nr:hypothetical protein [Microbulbifer thermotolerans]AMX03434.1 hypothetical protein A3224_13395 [Microbulbifer thermotolerans]MCX2778088.1 hypothetical protein [Microbulbifer thermotolerans]MCX2784654.1 hypothetical protein [Microbulbifer thermotolerans]MCX2796421.1 hypothetical protein [Microbulbifer thermotolerans]MCX2806242.1 hypothetical protein [Microbulbifer thermotolerans]
MKKYRLRMLIIWCAIVVVYCLFVLTTEYEFKLLELSAITNIFLLIALFKESGPQKVEDPVSFVKFSGGKIAFSEVSIPVNKVQKVALEVVENDCYFTLPYNQIEPGKFPSFVFPAKKFEEFRRHLLSGLGSVEIIT